MARSHLRYTVTDRAGNTIQNATVTLFVTGTSTLVTDLYTTASGGSAVASASLVSNSQGEVEGWLETPKTVDVQVADTSHAAYYSGAVGTLLSWSPFIETVEVTPPPENLALLDGANAWSGGNTFLVGPTFSTDPTFSGTKGEPVHLSQTEVITGAKTFSTGPTFSSNPTFSGTKGEPVHISQTETITGVKTFSAASTNFVVSKSKTSPVIDVTHPDNGVIADDSSDATATANLTAINALITANMAQSGGRVLKFPNGITYIKGGPIQINATSDTTAKIALVGGGKRSAQIQQKDSAQDIIQIQTTSGNIRDVVIKDLWLNFGANQINCSKAAYVLLDNVTFHQPGVFGLTTAVNSDPINLRHCWFMNNFSGGDSMSIGQGAVYADGCTYGENGGAIYVTAGNLYMTDCSFFSSYDRGANSAAGFQSMGLSLFTVSSSGSLSVVGGRVNLVHSMLNYDQPRRILFSSVEINTPNGVYQNDGTVFNARRNDANAPVRLVHSYVGCTGNVVLYGTNLSRDFSNITIANNEIAVGTLTTKTVTNRVLTSNVVTLTAAAHGFSVGNYVTVAGFTVGDTIFNGNYAITAVTTDTFSYALTHADVATGAGSGSPTATVGGDCTFDDRLLKPELANILSPNNVRRSVSSV